MDVQTGNELTEATNILLKQCQPMELIFPCPVTLLPGHQYTIMVNIKGPHFHTRYGSMADGCVSLLIENSGSFVNMEFMATNAVGQVPTLLVKH